jgi:glycosyltransferase involved in cell wall biosynthesis
VHADFHPNDERLTDLYATCDVVVVPTFADIGPLWVFLEAMAMGLPIIGTDTGANTELIRHGETGFVVGTNDGNDLAAAIQSLLRDPEEGRRMGRRGRLLVEAEYNASRNVPRILQTMKIGVERFTSAALVERPGR